MSQNAYPPRPIDDSTDCQRVVEISDCYICSKAKLLMKDTF